MKVERQGMNGIKIHGMKTHRINFMKEIVYGALGVIQETLTNNSEDNFLCPLLGFC